MTGLSRSFDSGNFTEVYDLVTIENQPILAEAPRVHAHSFDFYRRMYTIRRVEETLLLELFPKGLLYGTVHTCIGQEGGVVGVISALDRAQDVIWSNHRGHGHFLAYCDDVEGLIAEIMGKSTGVCGGIGGTQHIFKDNFYTNGILGGTVPCAVGTAFAEKLKGNQAVAVVFFGDGALGEGVIYESMNIASLWQVPILFVLEHNRYAQSTPYQLEHAGKLEARADAFDIPVQVMDGQHVAEVYTTASAMIDEIRTQQRPQYLVLRTNRFSPHSKGDDNRPPAELAAMRTNADPVAHLRAPLAQVDEARVEAIEAEVESRIQRAVEAAIAAPFLTSDAFIEGVKSW